MIPLSLPPPPANKIPFLSGIHDFGETCSSPISTNDEENSNNNTEFFHREEPEGFVKRKKSADYGDDDFQRKIKMFQTEPMERKKEGFVDDVDVDIVFERKAEMQADAGVERKKGMYENAAEVAPPSSRGYDNIGPDGAMTNGSDKDSGGAPAQDMVKVAAEETEDNLQDALMERVELPRQHRLDKVLFSMSSYRERVEPDKRPALERQFSDKLNANLATKQEIINARAEGRDGVFVNTPAPGPPATTPQTQVYVEHKHAADHKLETNRRTNPPATHRDSIMEGVREEGWKGPKQPLQPPPPPPKFQQTNESQQFQFRSRIIEEFETRRREQTGNGSMIAPGPGENTRTHARQFNQSGTAHHDTHTGDERSTQSLDRKGGMGGARDSAEQEGHGHSLDRSYFKEKGGPMSFSSIVSERRKLIEENHYDSPRSLMSKSSFTQFSNDDSQHIAIHASPPEAEDFDPHMPKELTKGWEYTGPPSISMGVWGENPRGPIIKIKEEKESRAQRSNLPPAERKTSQVQPTKQQNIPTLINDKDIGIQTQHRVWQPPVQRRQTKPDLPAKPIEIRYRDRREDADRREVMEDPRTAVLAASRPRAGGWRDELTRDMDHLTTKTKVDRRRSDEDGGSGRRRSEENDGDYRYISHNSLVERRRSQIEGGGRAPLDVNRRGSHIEGGERSNIEDDRRNNAEVVQRNHLDIERRPNKDGRRRSNIEGEVRETRAQQEGDRRDGGRDPPGQVLWDYNSSFKNFKREKDKIQVKGITRKLY